MASKFQNRLVGTVIIVALGVIILPGLLDGKKKHYKEEFAAIPLVPKPGDQQDTDMVPPVTQSLPAQPPEGAGAAASANSGVAARGDNPASSAPEQTDRPAVVTPPPLKPALPKPLPAKPAAPEAIEKPPARPEHPAPPKSRPAPAPAPQTEKVPVGQAWVVQLGALKNAARVNEIVARLRLSGYRAYTVPATPVQGQITRIYVGPDASKAKMQSAVGELKALSGLGGVVKPYSVR
ncbi:cell division protein DedD [Erwinia sp. OLTSP20]|uniref:cell division protein DedD n=1 Tax=unclassified Erwinia TaxID=2622719 RepID=UPI000C18DC43|nr:MULTISPECIES: cell division protein DedD [unclassified Erwinia]PIJ51504.1 cell division protein DedD [Erwinia sp. OAMSP11]PIJ68604.1 cell division protein DedD [Erwinia sp. OLSSP12]PIJ83415.1 cell division protein DedD [Erwinia sp. OLCASP19]PIJ86248.1 cell division protein DedD [Erwinia sp. OLMTSP26]PIJ88509.1 cell division protein DedD [Erwinia sp. OLMDSP33]